MSVAHSAGRLSEVRRRARISLIVLVPLLVATACPQGEKATNNSDTVAITIATGGGGGSGKVSGSGYSCDIVGSLASGTCTKQIPLNTQIAIAATPSSGSVFAGWGGACAAATGTCLLTASAAATATAKFDLPPNALTVASGGGTGDGTVTGNGINCAITAATQSGTCTVDLPPSTSAVLTATPAAGGFTFQGWGGACSGTATTCTVSMSEARSVTATFAAPAQIAITVASGGGNGNGTVTGSGVNCSITGATQTGTCSATVTFGSLVTLTETPAAGHTFAGWGGGVCTGTATTCTVTMSQARTVTASFTGPMVLTIASGGGTGTGTVTQASVNIACTISGVTTSGTCTANVVVGTVVTLTAAANAGGHVFAGWGGGVCTGTAPTCVVTMSQARTVTASFTAPVGFALTLTSGPELGNGTVTGNGLNCTFANGVATGTCSVIFATGTVVTLTATVGASSQFNGWGGACAGVTLICNVTMSQARAVTASFTPVVQFNLTVSSGSGSGNGSVTGSGVSCNITAATQSGTCLVPFNSGTVVTLTATESAGSVFTSWGGGVCAGSASTCNVTMSQARSVTAKFDLSFGLTVTAVSAMNGSGAVTGTGGINCSVVMNGSHVGSQSGTCSNSYVSGTAVTLTATATTGGYTFEGWGGACAGTGACNVTMSAARAVTAKFNAPSLATLQSSLFGVYCTSCHGTPAPFGTSTGSYNALVNQPSHSTGGWTLANTYVTLVVPYSASTSYVVYQVQKAAGANPMPTSATVVPSSIVTQLINWINGGARQTQQ